MANKQTKYVEPEGYFSKGMRKALGIGEYAKKSTDKKGTKKATTTKSKKK